MNKNLVDAPTRAAEPTEQKARRRGALRTSKPCGGMMRGHARGAKLEILLLAQNLAKLHRGIAWASAQYYERTNICTARRARTLMKELIADGWWEHTEFGDRPAYRVLTHAEWARKLGSPTCSLAAEGGSGDMERISAPIGKDFRERGKNFRGDDPEIEHNPIICKGITDNRPAPIAFSESPETIARVESGGGIDRPPSRFHLPALTLEEKPVLEKFESLYRERWGRSLCLRERHKWAEANLCLLCWQYPHDVLVEAWQTFLSRDDDYLVQRRHPFMVFDKQIEEYLPDRYLEDQEWPEDDGESEIPGG